MTIVTVLFEFFIILAGVYVAIAFDEFVTDRERATEAQAVLIAVASELQRDKEDIVDILEVQRDRLEAHAGIVAALEDPAGHPQYLDTLLRVKVSPNRTFFPRRSAYTVLLPSDQLIHVSDEALRLRLVDSFGLRRSLPPVIWLTYSWTALGASSREYSARIKLFRSVESSF